MKILRSFLLITVPTLALLFILTIAIDRCIGLFGDETNRNTENPFGLGYIPNSTVTYDTPEFHVTAQINQFGFRGRETTLEREHPFRVLMIGDSYTFGWGVSDDSTASFLAQQSLQQDGYDVEILNLGRPGTSPKEYARVIKNAVPILRPNLVVINFLAFDDFRQISPIEKRIRNQTKTVTLSPGKYALSIALRMKSRLGKFLPNIRRLITSLRVYNTRVSSSSIATEWSRSVAKMMTSLSTESVTRFEKIEPDVKNRYLDGQLNPGLFRYAFVGNGDVSVYEIVDPNSSDRLIGMQTLAGYLDEAKVVCEQNNSRLAFVLVPTKNCIDSNSVRQIMRIGFTYGFDILSISDDHARDMEFAAHNAGIPFYSAFNAFRSVGSESFFFPYDTHLNGRGQWLYSNYIKNIVINYINDN